MKKGWGISWVSKGVDGRHLLWKNCRPLFFDTKKKAKSYIDINYGYIKYRTDLRTKPHLWRMPKPVRAVLILKEIKP